MKRRSVGLLLMMTGGLASCLDASEPGNLVPKTVDEDPTIPAVSFAGSRFHLETFGDPNAPVIVFLHGGPGGDYRDNLRLSERHDGYALSDDHHLVFWDQRGSGLSRRHACDTFTLDRVDADLDELIDRVSPGRPVVLVGTSWGGMYATAYINRHPGKVAGAVLIEPGPLNGPLFESVAGEIFDLNVFGEVLNDVVWESRFISPDDHARADYALLIGARDGQPKYHQRTDHDPAPMWRLGAIANRCLQGSAIKDGKANYDFTDHLAAFTTPVRFIASAKNEVIGAAFQEKQRVYYPASELVVIPDVGHDITWVKPAAVVSAIHTYLTSISAGKVQ